MSSPCWSLPHLLSHSLPQHEAPPGQQDHLQEHSTHPAELLHQHLLREPQAHPAQLQTLKRSERIATSPLCDNEIQSGRTLRTTQSTGYEPKSLATDEFEPNEHATNEFMTTSRSSLEDIYQLYDVQKEFGEQDQQAPIVEEVKEFGQIGIQCLLDHEMTDTSPTEDMSCLQSRIHFDESIEIIAADSDLEDGELQNLLT